MSSIGYFIRYLKPPLIERAEIRPSPFNGEIQINSNPIENRRPSTPAETEDLLEWRSEVENATQAAPLHLCILYLEANIAWERSAMKAVTFFFFILS